MSSSFGNNEALIPRNLAKYINFYYELKPKQRRAAENIFNDVYRMGFEKGVKYANQSKPPHLSFIEDDDDDDYY